MPSQINSRKRSASTRRSTVADDGVEWFDMHLHLQDLVMTSGHPEGVTPRGLRREMTSEP